MGNAGLYWLGMFQNGMTWALSMALNFAHVEYAGSNDVRSQLETDIVYSL